jgi:tripartite-type tricarboxylate transporter receptor subunit TctC
VPYEVINWWGILAPAGTPAAIVERLHKDIAAIQDIPDMQKQLAAEGAEVVNMTSAEFGDFLVRETDKWGRVIKEGGIKPQ